MSSLADPGAPRAVPDAIRLDPIAAAAWRDGASVLDARDEDAFAAGHLPGAGRFMPAEFVPRRTELPPRTARVLVVHDDPALAREAATALTALEYRAVAWLDAPLATLPAGRASRDPAAPLWRPSPFLERMWPRLSPGRALDVAAGSCRDSVFLARHGFSVESWDHDPEALARGNELAARTNVRIATRIVALERVQDLPGGIAFDTIVVVRYLQRALFPWLERALAPGGSLLYETFRRGQERHGRPRQERYLLRDGELAAAFPALRVECYEESESEGGPVMAHLLARRD